MKYVFEKTKTKALYLCIIFKAVCVWVQATVGGAVLCL